MAIADCSSSDVRCHPVCSHSDAVVKRFPSGHRTAAAAAGTEKLAIRKGSWRHQDATKTILINNLFISVSSSLTV